MKFLTSLQVIAFAILLTSNLCVGDLTPKVSTDTEEDDTSE